jgi:hypothetical protein
VFQEYVRLHRAKNPPDEAKAQANFAHADAIGNDDADVWRSSAWPVGDHQPFPAAATRARARAAHRRSALSLSGSSTLTPRTLSHAFLARLRAALLASRLPVDTDNCIVAGRSAYFAI